MHAPQVLTRTALVALFFILGSFFAQAIAASELKASNTVQSFPVGPRPYGLTTDGENIWVTSFESTEMTKLRASDGANLGTFFAGGKTFSAVFDGANIWATNFLAHTVTKLRASDGTVLGTFEVGDG